MSINDWLRGKNRNNEDDVEYYEDTHDIHGNYIGKKIGTRHREQFIQNIAITPSTDTTNIQRAFSPAKTEGGDKSFANIVVYCPATIEEVEALITFLKRGEPAVSNLNGLEEASAQRILDFLSGAIFALGGNIHRISDNIFLLSPFGVEIQSYSGKNQNDK